MFFYCHKYSALFYTITMYCVIILIILNQTNKKRITLGSVNETERVKKYL